MKYMLMLMEYDETKTTAEQDKRFTDAVKELHAAANVAGEVNLYLLTQSSRAMYERMKIELQRSKV